MGAKDQADEEPDQEAAVAADVAEEAAEPEAAGTTKDDDIESATDLGLQPEDARAEEAAVQPPRREPFWKRQRRELSRRVTRSSEPIPSLRS